MSYIWEVVLQAAFYADADHLSARTIVPAEVRSTAAAEPHGSDHPGRTLLCWSPIKQ